MKVQQFLILSTFLGLLVTTLISPQQTFAAACDNPAPGQCIVGGSQVGGSTNCGVPGSGTPNIWCCERGFAANSATRTCITTADPDENSGETGAPGDAPTNQTFKNLNPIIIGSETNPNPDRNSVLSIFLGSDYMTPSPSGIINRALLFAFPIAGLILFLMILWGGFSMITGATSKKSIEEGQKRITSAVIGFLLLFVAYWIVKIIEAIFGLKIL